MQESCEFNGSAPRRPLGVYLFTLFYSLISLLILFRTLAFLPDAYAYQASFNPWKSVEAPIWTGTSLMLLGSSIVAFRGSRIGRACLTASLGIFFIGAFVGVIWELAQERGIADCASQLPCALYDWWNLGLAREWTFVPAWFAFHCWYFFGPRTRAFYLVVRNA